MFSQYFQHYLRVKNKFSRAEVCSNIFARKSWNKAKKNILCWRIQCGVCFFFPGGCLLAMFSHNKRREFWSPQPLRRPLIPSMMAPPSQPNHLPKAPPLKTITLGVRFYEYWEDTNIPYTTTTNLKNINLHFLLVVFYFYICDPLWINFCLWLEVGVEIHFFPYGHQIVPVPFVNKTLHSLF